MIQYVVWKKQSNSTFYFYENCFQMHDSVFSRVERHSVKVCVILSAPLVIHCVYAGVNVISLVHVWCI